MSLRIEWRSRAEGDDAIITVDDGTDRVLKSWPANLDVLVEFLNDMRGFTEDEGHDDLGDASGWGDLVIARSEAGDVLTVNPQLYWEGVAYWFRAHGTDPHLWRRRT
jgi:hypothetical protein